MSIKKRVTVAAYARKIDCSYGTVREWVEMNSLPEGAGVWKNPRTGKLWVELEVNTKQPGSKDEPAPDNRS